MAGERNLPRDRSIYWHNNGFIYSIRHLFIVHIACIYAEIVLDTLFFVFAVKILNVFHPPSPFLGNEPLTKIYYKVLLASIIVST